MHQETFHPQMLKLHQMLMALRVRQSSLYEAPCEYLSLDPQQKPTGLQELLTQLMEE